MPAWTDYEHVTILVNKASHMGLSSHTRSVLGKPWLRREEFITRLESLVNEFWPDYDTKPKEAAEAEAAQNSW